MIFNHREAIPSLSIVHYQLSIFYHGDLADFREFICLTAGNKHLTGFDLIQNKILTAGVQLRQHIVQQQHRFFSGVVPENFPLGQLQGNGRRPGLPLRTKGLQTDLIQQYIEVVLVGA